MLLQWYTIKLYKVIKSYIWRVVAVNQFHQPWKLIPSHVRGKGGREIGRFRGDQLAKDLPDGSECWVGAVNTVNNPPADNPYNGM